MKNALVIAGGQWQVPLIKRLQQSGYSVTVVDPYLTSAGVLIAEHHIQLDVRAREDILSAVNAENITYSIVCTDQSDISVDTVAYIAEAIGVPGNTLDAVNRFSNKYNSRQYAQTIGMSVPQFTSVDSLQEIIDFREGVGAPLIIKPCDAQSSKGIHVIEAETSKQEIEEYLADALQYSFVKKCILEQFVSGYEITVEGFCANGKHHVTAMSKKRHFKTGIASTLTYPGNEIPEHLRKQIAAIDDKYVENSGLAFGPTHAEYIVNEVEDKFWLVEIACRGGGTLISSDIVHWVSGFDVYENYIRCLEGHSASIDMHTLIPTQKSAELHFFDFGSGIIESIRGFDNVKQIPGVIYADFPYKVGDSIRSCQDDRSRQGFVIVFAENPQELQNKLMQIQQTFIVTLRS